MLSVFGRSSNANLLDDALLPLLGQLSDAATAPPFEELRTQSLLRDEAVTAADPDFSRRIRAALVQPPAASGVWCLKAGRGAQREPND